MQFHLPKPLHGRRDLAIEKRSRRALNWVAGVIAVAACARLLSRMLLEGPGRDSFYFWVAGRMWARGLDPYGTGFLQFPFPYPKVRPVFWLYPPQWWIIATPFGFISARVAPYVWEWMQLVCLVAGVALLWRASDRLRHPPHFWLKALFIGVLATAQPTRSAVHGQTGLMMFLGFALFLTGFAFNIRWRTLTGLVLVLLKPQLGLPLLLVCLTIGRTRKDAVVAIVLSALGSVPVLLTFGPKGLLESSKSVATNLQTYSTHWENDPAAMVGAASLFSSWTAIALSLPVVLVASAAVVRIILHYAKLPETRWVVILLGSCALDPLHTYDLSFVLITLLCLPGLPAFGRVAILLVATLVHRSDAIAIALCRRFGTVSAGIAESVSSGQWCPDAHKYQAEIVTVGIWIAILLLLGQLYAARSTAKRNAIICNCLPTASKG